MVICNFVVVVHACVIVVTWAGKYFSQPRGKGLAKQDFVYKHFGYKVALLLGEH